MRKDLERAELDHPPRHSEAMRKRPVPRQPPEPLWLATKRRERIPPSAPAGESRELSRALNTTDAGSPAHTNTFV